MMRTPLASIAALVLAAASCHPHSTATMDPVPTSSATQLSATAAGAAGHLGTSPGHAGAGTPLAPAEGHQLAAFAEGCFWGSENTFRHVDGVVATAVGYAGGTAPKPTYSQVSAHVTGHAETVLVEFDPKKVTYAELLQDFWDSHDPTTMNRQGPDVGNNYRSEIFFFSPEEEAQAKASMGEQQKKLDKPITTLVAPIGQFWIAEDYHQQYDEKSGRESCPLPQAKAKKGS